MSPPRGHSGAAPPKTYLIIGASRGIGLEFCRQLLARNQRVIATARAATGASQLWALTGTENGMNLSILECDVADEESVRRFVAALGLEMGKGKRLSGGAMIGAGGLIRGGEGGVNGGGMGWEGRGGGIDVCVVNAGVLIYPNRVMELTYAQFAHHLTTNTIGPLLVAAAILRQNSPPIPISTLVFMSSDSGSAAKFRAFEDGFAAYAASKAALNQGLRHLAAELHRRATEGSSKSAAGTGSVIGSRGSASSGTAASTRTAGETVVLALHPGEVATDMASNVDVAWEVEGIITPEESVRKMLRVIDQKGKGGVDERGGEPGGVATFWDWEGRAYPW